MIKLLLAILIAVPLVTQEAKSDAPDGTGIFAVCVTTTDSAERFDSAYDFLSPALARRAQILAEGWIIEEEPDPTGRLRKESVYPPHSIVRATVDRADIGTVCGVTP